MQKLIRLNVAILRITIKQQRHKGGSSTLHALGMIEEDLRHYWSWPSNYFL